MSKNFKILFYLKRGRNCNKNSLPIYVRVTINGERTEWTCQRNCDPKKWNQQSGRATGYKEEIKNLNQYLDAIRANIIQIHTESFLRNEPIKPNDIRAKALNSSEEKEHSLIEVYQYHNTQFEKLVGTEFSYGTYKRFKSALHSLQEFLNWKFNKQDVTLTTVTHQFICDYEFYLKGVRHLQHNSAMVNIKKLKKIIRLCVANDWLDKDPFRSYKITTRETHRNFLSARELEILRSEQIRIQRLDQVRDIFLFSCYTGLSYCDVIALSRGDISIGVDGGLWIFTNRTKTDTPSRIPLLPIAKDIMDKYSLRPDIINSERLFPKISNQKLNSYLKELGDVCRFNKKLTFHCARHTFATTVTLSNGVPIETVSKMLGHRSLRTTQIYAKVLDDKISNDMKALKNKLFESDSYDKENPVHLQKAN